MKLSITWGFYETIGNRRIWNHSPGLNITRAEQLSENIKNIHDFKEVEIIEDIKFNYGDLKKMKLCKDCKYFELSIFEDSICSYIKEPIFGSGKYFAYLSRSQVGHCGEDGKHFEQKPPSFMRRIISIIKK